MKIRLPIFIAVWIGFACIKIPTWALGWVVVPFLYRYRATHYDDLPWWTRPWANPEDWTGGPEGVVGHSVPEWWLKERGEGRWAFYMYHAKRNPANGLRSFEWLDLDIKQGEVEYYTPVYYRFYESWYWRKLPELPRTGWYLAWQGWRAGYKFVHIWPDKKKDTTLKLWRWSYTIPAGPKYFEFKFGWRVEPRDAHEPLNPDGQRALEGAGFASKFLPYRNG